MIREPSAIDQVWRHWPRLARARPSKMLSGPNTVRVDIQNVVDLFNSKYSPGDLVTHGACAPPWASAVLFWRDTLKAAKLGGAIYMVAMLAAAPLPPEQGGGWILLVTTMQLERPGLSESFFSGGFCAWLDHRGMISLRETPSGPASPDVVLWGNDHAGGELTRQAVANAMIESVATACMPAASPEVARAQICALRNIASAGDWRQDTHRDAMYVLYALTLANCKNVAPRDAGETACPKPWIAPDHPRLRYRVLHIGGMSARGSSGLPTDGPSVSLHMVRGHFATYTSERPLFGKYVGQFWVPQHVRGDEKIGTVVKDYKIGGAA